MVASDVAYGIVQSPNLGFLVTGTAGDFPDETFALWRLNTDGSFNAAFGTAGAVYTNIGADPEEANAIAIQDDSHVIIAGKTRGETTNFDFAVLRYNDAPLTINQIAAQADWTIYPNPLRVGDKMNFIPSTSASKVTRIELIDSQGRIIESLSPPNNGSAALSMSGLVAAGLYQVRLMNANQSMKTVTLLVTE